MVPTGVLALPEMSGIVSVDSSFSSIGTVIWQTAKHTYMGSDKIRAQEEVSGMECIGDIK